MMQCEKLFKNSFFVANEDRQHSVARIATLNSRKISDAESVEQA